MHGGHRERARRGSRLPPGRSDDATGQRRRRAGAVGGGKDRRDWLEPQPAGPGLAGAVLASPAPVRRRAGQRAEHAGCPGADQGSLVGDQLGAGRCPAGKRRHRGRAAARRGRTQCVCRRHPAIRGGRGPRGDRSLPPAGGRAAPHRSRPPAGGRGRARQRGPGRPGTRRRRAALPARPGRAGQPPGGPRAAAALLGRLGRPTRAPTYRSDGRDRRRRPGLRPAAGSGPVHARGSR